MGAEIAFDRAPTGDGQFRNTPKRWKSFGFKPQRLNNQFGRFNVVSAFDDLGRLAARGIRRTKAHFLHDHAININAAGKAFGRG